MGKLYYLFDICNGAHSVTDLKFRDSLFPDLSASPEKSPVCEACRFYSFYGTLSAYVKVNDHFRQDRCSPKAIAGKVLIGCVICCHFLPQAVSGLPFFLEREFLLAEGCAAGLLHK